MTWRRLQVLIDHALPDDGALKTAIRENLPNDLPPVDPGQIGRGPWGRQTMLLADIADQIAVNTFVVATAHGARVSPPKPIPRPGVKTERREPASPALLMQLQLERAEHRRRQQEAARAGDGGQSLSPSSSDPSP